MELEITMYLRNKFSSLLQEAEEDPSKLPLMSRFRLVDRQINFMFESLTRIDKEPALQIRKALYDLMDALSECRVRAHQLGKSATSKSLFIVTNPFSEFFFKRRIKNRLQDIEKSLKIMDLHPRNFAPTRLVPQTYPRTDTSTIIGFDSEAKKIENLLLNSSSEDFTAIGIVGRCGSGKTALAQTVFNSSKIREYFSPMIWICLSNMLHQDMRARVLKYMLEELGHDISELEYEDFTINQLLQKLERSLRGKRYLIVLDDAWRADEWYSDLSYMLPRGYPIGDRFSHGLPKGCGAGIIVTSRRDTVVRQIVGTKNLVQLEPHLKDDICWDIFSCAVEEDGIVDVENEELIGLEDEIIRNCDGLPLAAVTLAKIIPSRINESKQWLPNYVYRSIS